MQEPDQDVRPYERKRVITRKASKQVRTLSSAPPALRQSGWQQLAMRTTTAVVFVE